MAGMSGTFDNEDDFNLFLQAVYNKSTNFPKDKWSDPDSHDTIHETMDDIQTTLSKLHREGFKSKCQTCFMVNDKLKSYAKKPSDLDWGWWRDEAQRIDLRHDDGTWVGNDSPYLIRTILHLGAGIIKHDYSARPEPIELSVSTFEQNGVKAYMGVANAGVLDSICSVPWMQADMLSKDFADKILNRQMDINKWQRVINHKRVDSIRNFAEQEDKNLFNPVLLYVDKKDVKEYEDENGGTTVEVPFDFLEHFYGSYTDYFPLPEERDQRPIWIIDGQHRIRGFGSSKRGSRMPIPYVLLVGDGSADTVASIALLFTQINTKSEPLDDLHKIYLNYQFGIETPTDDFSIKRDKNGKEITGHSSLPKPTKRGRPSRRAYELALFLAAHPESPILDCVIFQKPPGKNPSNKNVTNSKNFLSHTTSWFKNSIYKKEKLDEICNIEVLNFFKAFKSQCDSWPNRPTLWHVGRANNKSFLQQMGPFPTLLHTHKFCVESLVEKNPDIDRPISQKQFKKLLEPIQWVDWNSSILKKSSLSGRKNDNIKHLNLWIQTAIKKGVSYDHTQTLSSELTSTPGKGLLALPSANKPKKISGDDFPSVAPFILEVEVPHHCLRVKWEAEMGDGDTFIDLVLSGNDKGKKNGNTSTVTISSPQLEGNRVLRVRAVFVNGIGSSKSKWLTYYHPSYKKKKS